MPLIKALAETISSIIINIISNDLDSQKNSLLLSIKIKFHFGKTKKWINKFIKQHDGTFFTSNIFERYLTYQKPINKLHDYIFVPECNINENSFILECVQDCKEYFEDNNYYFGPRDESSLIEFYKRLLNSFKEFLSKQLTLPEKTIVSETHRTGNEIINTIKKENNDIKSLLVSKEHITDTETIHNVYKHINKEILNCEFEKIYNLLPLIEKKNDDLENAIKIKLHILSIYNCLTQDLLTVFSNINDSFIQNDITRLLILHYFEDIDTLLKLKQQTINNDLSSIIECIINKDTTKFFELDEKKQNNTNIYQFKLMNHFKDEQWLIKRLCILFLSKKTIINGYELVHSLIKDDQTYLDKLVLCEKEIDNILLTFDDSIKNKTNNLNELSNALLQKRSKFEKCNIKTQLLFYKAVTKALASCDNEKLLDIYPTIPQEIKKAPKIEALHIYVKSINKKIQKEELIDFCIKSQEYWVLSCYLSTVLDNPKEILTFLSDYLFLLEKDATIFFIYYCALRKEQGIEEAKNLLKKYEHNYSDHLEYWIELYSVTPENKSNIIDIIFEKWNNNELSATSFYTEVDFITILSIEGKYNQALDVVTKLETLGFNFPELLKRKAFILNNLKRTIDAFQIFLDIFDYFHNDLSVIGTILTIAVNYKREVPQKIIDAAIKIGTSHLLMLVSIIYEKDNKLEDSFTLATKSLLLAKEENEPIYGYYLGLLTKSSHNRSQQSNDANDDTAVYLESKSTTKIYCIHKKDILPQKQFFSYNAIHIHRDTAIEIGLLRKKIGTKIIIDGIEYIIKEILSLDSYFFKLCIGKLIDNGDCKQISIQSDSKDKIDITELTTFMKENTASRKSLNDFISQYNDTKSFPLTLYTLSRYSKLTYEEFIFNFLQDTQMHIREITSLTSITDDRFILSFSVLATLYKLNIPIESLANKDLVIAASTMQEINDADKKIIEENNKENVASMGMIDDQIYFHSASEEEKSYFMQEATKFKNYAQCIMSEDNTKDISISLGIDIDSTEVYGICDYDTISIAKNNNRTIVTFEPMISFLSIQDKDNISAIGLVDFLCTLDIPIFDFFDYINKLVEYRFIVTLTEKSFNYILEQYNQTNDEETKETIVERWVEYLSSAESIEDNYKSHFINVLTQVFMIITKSSFNIRHPIYYYFCFYYMDYNNFKFKAINDNGQIKVKLVKIDESH